MVPLTGGRKSWFMEPLVELVKRLLQRRETAGLLVGAITLMVVFLPLPLFAAALALFSLAVGYELELITGRKFLRWIALGGYLFSLVNPYWGLLFSAIAALGVGYWEVLKRGHYSHYTLLEFLLAFLVAVYGGLFVSTFVGIKEHSTHLLLALVLSIWGADTAAYYIGKQFGRNPFFSLISPKKTLEGFLGGLLVGTLIGSVVSSFGGYKSIGPLGWFFVVSVSALGDLFESFIKRSFGVKDSSNLLGSHGGILDRFDAMLFASLALSALLN